VQIGHLAFTARWPVAGPGLSDKRTLADKSSLSVNTNADNGKADSLIAGWEDGQL